MPKSKPFQRQMHHFRDMWIVCRCSGTEPKYACSCLDDLLMAMARMCHAREWQRSSS